MTPGTHRGFSINRTLAASPEQVFGAWTEPDRLGWFGNSDPEHPTSVDLRAGGCWRIHLVQPDGERYWTGGTYREIVPARRIRFTWGTVGGWPDLDPAQPDHNPVITVQLAPVTTVDRAVASGTDLTLHLTFPERIDDEGVQRWMRLGIEPGWAQTVDRLTV